MTIRAGLDVGGAHLKVALVEDGCVRDVRQYPCRLWMGMEHLDAALREAAPLLAPASTFAVTMTGELSDVFPDRLTGTETLIARLSAAFGPATRFWMGARGFGSADEARAHPRDVGSTNFLATAELVGRRAGDALLIDFGSTTADIVPIRNGVPATVGLTDAVRQATGELVYTGFTRTAVMGVASRAPFDGSWVSLSREYLATMADVRRVLGIDIAEVDQHATADGKDKSLPASLARLARMLGRDASDGSAEAWRAVAASVREAQLRSIHDGAEQVISRTALPDEAPVVTAGIGAADVAVIAGRLGRPSIAFCGLIGAPAGLALWTTACAPAVSVALLGE